MEIKLKLFHKLSTSLSQIQTLTKSKRLVWYNEKSSSLPCSTESQGERANATIHTLNFNMYTRVKGLP